MFNEISGAVTVSSTDICGGQDRDQLLSPVLDESGTVTLSTIHGDSLISIAISIEQLLKQAAAYAVRSGPNRHLARLQINVPALFDLSKYAPHHPIYFLRGFQANCLCNFFFRASNST